MTTTFDKQANERPWRIERSRRPERTIVSFKRRRGFTIIEVSVAVFLLFVCLTSFAQLRSTLALQRLRMKTATVALSQIQNVFEILKDVPPDALESGDFAKEKVERLIANSLPEGRLEFEILPFVFQKKTVDNVPNDGSENETANSEEVEDDSSNENGEKTASRPDDPTTVRLLKATVSWSDGTGRPRRSLSLVRILP